MQMENIVATIRLLDPQIAININRVITDYKEIDNSVNRTFAFLNLVKALYVILFPIVVGDIENEYLQEKKLPVREIISLLKSEFLNITNPKNNSVLTMKLNRNIKTYMSLFQSMVDLSDITNQVSSLDTFRVGSSEYFHKFNELHQHPYTIKEIEFSKAIKTRYNLFT